MKKIIKKLMANNGVIAIEFSFIYIIFMVFVFIIFEMCKFFFVVIVMDYSLSEAAKISAHTDKASKRDYVQVFDEYFFKQNEFWVMFVDPKDITVDARFCTNVNDIIKDKCSSVYSDSKRLALYSVSYRYRPMKLFSGIESMFSNIDGFLTRKVVYMIESSR